MTAPLAQRWQIARAESMRLLARKPFDESEHPREPAGSPTGGQFTSGGGGSTEAPKGKTKAKVEDFSKDGVILDDATRIDREKQEKFLKTWDDHVGQAPAEFRNKFLGGLKGTMRLSYNESSQSFALSGELQDEDGDRIGEYSREIDFDDKYAYSAYFKLSQGKQGSDVGKTLLAANIETYKALGIDKVKVSANIDVGGYAWARYGYVPTPGAWDELSGTISNRLDGMAGGGRSSGGDTYTPESWDEIGESDRDRIYEAWRRDSRSEFLQSEEENWRESGGALDAGKTDLADDYDADKDWALAALSDWRKNRKGEVPFTDQQIADAISVSYDSDGEGRNDPEFDFHDSRLTEPAGFDPAQQTLPGIEEIEPHELLTEDMRDEIADVLTKEFNSKAQDRADRMDAPDYLADSVDEYQSEYWEHSVDDDYRYRWARDHGQLPEIELEPDEDDDQEPVEVENADTLAVLQRLANSNDPKALWQIADSEYGKELLLNSHWSGVLNLNDKETMDRFNAYVSKGKKK